MSEWARVSGGDEFFRRVLKRFEDRGIDEGNDVDFLSICGYGSCVGSGNFCGYDELCGRLLSTFGAKQRRWFSERVVEQRSVCELRIHQFLSDDRVEFSVSTSSKVRRSDFRTVCCVFLLLLPCVTEPSECRTHAGLLRRVYDWHDRGIYDYGRLVHGALLHVGLCT